MQELSKSLAEFNKEFKGLAADSKNPFFKSTYISLDGILQTVRPLLSKHGLSVIQEATSDGEYAIVQTTLLHISGESYVTDKLKMKPVKNDPQGFGSCITYCKRYQLGALLGICESVDDDGNGATGLSEKNLENNAKVLTPVQAKIIQEAGSNKNISEIKNILKAYGYKTSKEILVTDFNKILEAIKALEDKQ